MDGVFDLTDVLVGAIYDESLLLYISLNKSSFVILLSQIFINVNIGPYDF